ncbi:MAG TPA: sugar ABC transporter permease [Ktedonobacteraceae bacterium]
MSALKVTVPADGAPREVGQDEKRPSRRHLRKASRPYVFIAPAVVFEFFIHILPMVIGIGISLLGLTLFYVHYWTAAPFIGLQNYVVALNFGGAAGSALLHSFLITVAYTVLVVGSAWVLGMTAALLLNGKFRGRSLFRTLFLIPYAIPAYVEIIAWNFMLQQNTGSVNAVLRALHISNPPFWLIGTNAFWSMVMTAAWRSWPFAFLFLLAGLQTIAPDLYEAASLEGASKWQQFRLITLPMLKPVNVVLLLVTFLWTFNDFNTPYVLFGAAPPPAADLLSLHIYINSFVNWNFGLGSAMSVLLLIFLFIVSIIYLRIFQSGGETQ